MIFFRNHFLCLQSSPMKVLKLEKKGTIQQNGGDIGVFMQIYHYVLNYVLIIYQILIS